MSPESNQTPQFSDYPVNPFEEPRDHANQWDVSALWPDHKPKSREEKRNRHINYRSQRARDHANQWDVSVLWPTSKSQARNDEAE